MYNYQLFCDLIQASKYQSEVYNIKLLKKVAGIKRTIY